MTEEPTRLPAGLEGEIIPAEHGLKAADRALRRALGAVFEKQSIDCYTRVFGAVPDRPPYRQWLYAGKGNYVHIADVWINPAYRQRVLTLIRNRRTAGRLHRYLLRDLEYLDEFAEHCSALAGPRRSVQKPFP